MQLVYEKARFKYYLFQKNFSPVHKLTICFHQTTYD
jgi:hypothetical protein